MHNKSRFIIHIKHVYFSVVYIFRSSRFLIIFLENIKYCAANYCLCCRSKHVYDRESDICAVLNSRTLFELYTNSVINLRVATVKVKFFLFWVKVCKPKVIDIDWSKTLDCICFFKYNAKQKFIEMCPCIWHSTLVYVLIIRKHWFFFVIFLSFAYIDNIQHCSVMEFFIYIMLISFYELNHIL